MTKRAEAAASWTPVSQLFTAKTHHTLWKAARTSETEYANGSFKGKDLIRGILVGGYSFAFLKQGCYSYFCGRINRDSERLNNLPDDT